MASLESIRKSLNTANELHSVVKTMKGIAAANIRQFERAVEALGDYSRALELGLQVLLRTRSVVSLAGEEDLAELTPGLIIFGSDQGMAGRFNQQIVDYLNQWLPRLAIDRERMRTAVVGGRVAPLLEAEGFAVGEQVSPASSLEGIGALVRRLILRIDAWREESVERVVLFHNESRGGASYAAVHRQLLPLDPEWLGELRARPWPSNRLPMHSLPGREMLAALLRERVYIGLYRASAESLASENASRLASMQAAEGNIEDRIGVLTMKYRHVRQQSITEELFDIVSGFEAMSS
jgi:F-type H+-transporting ATPase subunit gamma